MKSVKADVEDVLRDNSIWKAIRELVGDDRMLDMIGKREVCSFRLIVRLIEGEL